MKERARDSVGVCWCWWIPDPCLVLFMESSVCFIVGPSGINGSKKPIPLEPLFSTPTNAVPPFRNSTRISRLKQTEVEVKWEMYF